MRFLSTVFLRSEFKLENIYASVNSSCAHGCQIPRGGDEKRGQMSRPPSTLQRFPLIAQSSSAILSIIIIMCDFLFQFTSSFVIVLF